MFKKHKVDKDMETKVKGRPGPQTEQFSENKTVVRLIELRSGLFINPDQVVSVRVLSQEEGELYAMLQLSNGEKLNLTRKEFTAISGEEPRETMRLSQKSVAKLMQRPVANSGRGSNERGKQT